MPGQTPRVVLQLTGDGLLERQAERKILAWINRLYDGAEHRDQRGGFWSLAYLFMILLHAGYFFTTVEFRRRLFTCYGCGRRPVWDACRECRRRSREHLAELDRRADAVVRMDVVDLD